VRDLADELGRTRDEIEDALLRQPAGDGEDREPDGQQPVVKLHAFFSQGRAIAACLQQERHLNDRGERVCAVCAQEGHERAIFPLVFCRACGQEYWSVAVDRDGNLHPANLDDIEAAQDVRLRGRDARRGRSGGCWVRLLYVIDNRAHKLADTLNDLLASEEVEALDMATACCNVGGFDLLREGLEELVSFCFLLGSMT
jgi:hypothetical protein